MIKFYHYNLIQQSNTVISDPNANALFPLTNLSDSRTTKVYRSTTPSTSIVFDFISAEEVDSILIIPNQMQSWGFYGSVTIEANPTNVWSSPAFSTTLLPSEIDQEHLFAAKEWVAQEYRFWRITATGTNYVEFSKIFLGKKQTIGNRSISFNWQYQDGDNSIITTNRYGQRFADIVNRQKRFSFQFELLNKSEIDDFFSIYDYCGKYKPFFVRIGCDTMINNPNRFAGYVFFEDMPVITNSFWGRYNLEATLVEAT